MSKSFKASVFVMITSLLLSFPAASDSFAEDTVKLTYEEDARSRKPAQEAASRQRVATPEIRSLDPVVLALGEHYTIQIKGRNLTKDIELDFGKGIQVKKPKVSPSGTSAAVSVLVSKTARTGKRDVFLVSSGKKEKAGVVHIDTTERIGWLDMTPEEVEAFRARQMRNMLPDIPPLPESEQAPEFADLETNRIPEESMLNIVSPNGGEILRQTGRTEIAWRSMVPIPSGESLPPFTITLIASRGETELTGMETRYSEDSNLYYAVWDIPGDLANGPYTMRISSGEFSDMSDAPFYIGTFGVTSVAPGTTWYVTQTETIRWEVNTTSLLDTGTYEVHLLNSGGEQIYNLSLPGGVAYSGSGSVEWTVGTAISEAGGQGIPPAGELIPEGSYIIRVAHLVSGGEPDNYVDVPVSIRYPHLSVSPVSSPDGRFSMEDEIPIRWTVDNLRRDQYLEFHVNIASSAGTSRTIRLIPRPIGVSENVWSPENNRPSLESVAGGLLNCSIDVGLQRWEEHFHATTNTFELYLD